MTLPESSRNAPKSRPPKMVQVARTLEEALRIAQSAATREDLICITGSFYLVAEAMREYGAKALQ